MTPRSRFSLLTVALAAAGLLWAAPATAITWGEPDERRHPNVGSLLWDHDPLSPGIETACTGTLIAPRVFLTAAHCDPDFSVDRDRVVVSFDEDVQPVTASTRLHAGRFIGHPGLTHPEPDPHDIAVVVLDRPLHGIVPARLPTQGLLDRMHAAGRLDEFTVVGYGVQETQLYDGRRRSAVSTFADLDSVLLHLSQNPLRGEGGTCGRDSGGPAFPGEGRQQLEVVVAITYSGDLLCTYSGEYYRLDTESARQFLGQFVTLPS